MADMSEMPRKTRSLMLERCSNNSASPVSHRAVGSADRQARQLVKKAADRGSLG